MKRIIFVDDEQELLNSLRARLHKRRHEWEMVFISNGADAFVELEKQPADLIVTDVRMPGIDGRELLTLLKSHWPETIRIVLSGHSDQLQQLQLISLAHQYISKPCNAQQLENVIDRCFALQDLLRNDKLRSLVGRISSLPTMPKIYSEMQTVLAQPDASTAKLADIINRDAAIATKVLQVANSSFFRLSKPMTRIKDAVGYLGFSSIRNLVMSAEIFCKWENAGGPHGLDAERLQAHALATAAACSALAAKTPLADDAWLVGLIHDIGYWVLIKECPADLLKVLALAESQQISTYAAEQQIIGATHAEVGAYLLGLWGLPYALIEAVAYHHTPYAVAHHSFDLLGILTVAHSLLDTEHKNALRLNSEINSEIGADYFASLNAPFDWEEATRRVHSTYSDSGT